MLIDIDCIRGSRAWDPVAVSSSIPEQKTALRRRMRLMRDLIDDRVLRSIGLWAEVAALPAYASATCVMAFAATRGEPDTDSLFARLAADGKTLVLPSVEDDAIVPRLVGAGLVPGAHGIQSPQGDVVAAGVLDLVLVPGLAFTSGGARLGQGGGHYDRFLAQLPASCVTVGVCFAEQLVDDVPSEQHDANVSCVVADALPE